nr:hypothetical protein [Vallitalea guaymasensis]
MSDSMYALVVLVASTCPISKDALAPCGRCTGICPLFNAIGIRLRIVPMDNRFMDSNLWFITSGINSIMYDDICIM